MHTHIHPTTTPGWLTQSARPSQRPTMANYHRRRSIVGTSKLLLILLHAELSSSFRSHLSSRQLQLTRRSTISPTPALFSKTDDLAGIGSSSSPYSPRPYEILPIERVIDYLAGASGPKRHLQTGLTYSRAQTLLDQIGPNVVEPPRKSTIWELWLAQFDDTLVKILVGVAIASAAFSTSEVWDVLLKSADVDTSSVGKIVSAAWTNPELKSTITQSVVEPTIIIAILLLNAMVGVWQDLSARSSIEALEKMQPKLCTVLRCSDDDIDACTTSASGKWITDYDATKLVPGDVIRLRVGDAIPADSRLVTLASSTMYVDESSLTGESVSAEKLPGDEGFVAVPQSEVGDDSKTTIPIQDQKAMLCESPSCVYF